ncbi:MAG: effector binding domain-containing protein [Chlamydiales bacterium]|nr:effector binding domain-containing protein [Chlamydiales bacterium]
MSTKKLEYNVVKKEAQHFIGLPVRITDPERAIDWISALWDRFYRELVFLDIPNRKTDDIYGIYTDYAGDYTKPYTLIAACEVNSVEKVPEGLIAHTSPAQSYAHFEVIGAFPDNLIDKWGEVWKSDLKRTYKSDFEYFGPEFKTEPPQVDLFIGIET